MSGFQPTKFLSPSRQFLEKNRGFFKMILGESATEADIRRHSKIQWKALSSKDRKVYVEMRNADKARYEQELERFSAVTAATTIPDTDTSVLESRVSSLEDENATLRSRIEVLETQVAVLSAENSTEHELNMAETPAPPALELTPLPFTDKRVKRIKSWNLNAEKLFIATNIDTRTEWELKYGVMNGSGLKDMCRKQAKKELKIVWDELSDEDKYNFEEAFN